MLRRRFLTSASAPGLIGLAGCTGFDSTSSDSDDDGVIDTADYAPWDSDVQRKADIEPQPPTPGQSQPPAPGGSQSPTRSERDTGQFAEETGRRAKEFGAIVQRSVVMIRGTTGGQGATLGTGWLIADGQIVTNSHVIQDSTTFSIETFDHRTGEGTRQGYRKDLIPDVGLLSTELQGIPALPTGSSDALTSGQPVIQVGHPAGVGTWVISLGRFKEHRPAQDWLLSDIPSNSGNSGSPLLTLEGNVVGVTSGGTPAGPLQSLDRPERVFTSFPTQKGLVTSNPIETVQKWVNRWSD